MNRVGLLSLVPLFLGLVTSVEDSHAAAITIFGTPGESGASGTEQHPSGFPGTAGGPALAIATDPGEAQNSATAKGGPGGNGGSGTPGGGGGAGGSATAIAGADRRGTGGGDVEASAEADGGPGGLGGAGLFPSGDGSSAIGGAASATASALTTAGKVRSSASADNSYWIYAATGTATASATGGNTSSDPVLVTAWAGAGNGRLSSTGAGAPGETASLGPVSGSSSGGGRVDVSGSIAGGRGGAGATAGGNGADATLTNAVTGTTTGPLFLYQQVRGGSGGTGQSGGAGGSASSYFTHHSPTASDLVLNSYSLGGYGGWGGGAAGPAIGELHASAAAGSVSAAYIQVTGGDGGTAAFAGQSGAPGGSAVLLPSSASTSLSGSNVSLQAYQGGGNGGNGGGGGASSGGNGADSFMTDLLTGSAPGGILRFEQSAGGGSGGRNLGGEGGDGGDASSVLHFTHSGEAELNVRLVSSGGTAGSTVGNNQSDSPGGSATTVGEVQDSGKVVLESIAYGGQGNLGGDASSTASAKSTGDGEVNVTATAYGGLAAAAPDAGLPGLALLSAYGESQGGRVAVVGEAQAGSADFGEGHIPSQVAGRSVTLSNAVTGRTSGKLYLYQTARGGNGGAGEAPTAATGAGGHATSALVLPNGNPGGGDLDAYALATGGGSLVNYPGQTAGAPGNATATCILVNAGNVHASASGYGGISTDYVSAERPGEVNVTANAVSTKAYAWAWADAYAGNSSGGQISVASEAFGGIVTRVKTEATRPSVGEVSLSATSSAGSASPNGGSLVATGLPGTGIPTGGPNTAGLQGMTALARVQVSALFTTGSASFEILTGNFTGNARLALLSGSLTDPNGTVTNVNLTVTRGATTLLSQNFTDWTALNTYFTDHVLDLGSVAALNAVPLKFTFTLTGGDRFASLAADLAVAAEEKSAFQLWAEALGFTGNDALPGADPDKDGLVNMVEWAYGLDAASGSSSQLPAFIRSGENLITIFNQPTDVTGVTYGAEWSTTLEPDSWTPIPDTGVNDQHLFSVPVAGGRMFIRHTFTW